MNNPLTEATRIIIVREDSEDYHYDFDLQQLVCSHINAYIEKACCSSAGLVECGCNGLDSVICPNVECTGIEDYEVDELFERLR